MREEAVTPVTTEKAEKNTVRKKDQVTLSIGIVRGIDVVYLERMGISDILGKKELHRADVPLTVTVSRDDSVRLRQYRHALIVTKLKEGK